MNPVKDPVVLAMLNSPGQTTPPMPGTGAQNIASQQAPPPVAQSPQGSQQPFNGIDPVKLISLFSKVYPDKAQDLIGSIIQNKTGLSSQDPLKQAQTNYLNWKMNQGGSSAQYATPQQALQYMGDSPENRAFVQSMGDRIPWSEIKGKATLGVQTGAAKERGLWADAAAKRANIIQENTIYNALNTLDKSSGGVLGQAGVIQFRAKRGIDFLTSKNIKQDALTYNLLQSDLAAIAQGGSPSIAAQAEATLPTYKQQANELLRKITADPQSINQPEIKKQLLNIFTVMDNTAGGILEQNTAGVKAIFGQDPWVKAHPEAFKNAILAIGMGIKPQDPNSVALPLNPGNQGGGDSGGDDSGNDADVDALLRTANQ